jgi:hypothetical protein
MRFNTLCLAMIFLPWLASAVCASDFEIEATPVAGRTFAGGPVVIDVSIRYTGTEPLTIGWCSGTGGTGSIVDLHQGFGLGTPPGWAKRKVANIQSGNILSSSDTLEPGDVIKKTLYLHYCFSEIPPGKATLELSYSICEPGGIGTKLLALLSTSVELDIKEGSTTDLSSVFSEIVATLRNSRQSYEKRLDACRQLIWVKHDRVIPFLFEILQDEKLVPCHGEAQTCLYAFSRKSRSILDALVSYLQESGTKNDSLYFFSLWKRDKVDIKWGFILKLLQSPREWVKTADSETFGQNASELHQQKQETEPKSNSQKPQHPVTIEEQTEVKSSTQWFVPVLIIAGILLVGVIIFLFVRRR